MENNQTSVQFADRVSVEQIEESAELAPKFDANGVIPCITIHAQTREVLMFAYMNEQAMKLTMTTGFAHYWSRSRKKLWKKGESSGMFQKIECMLIDDDQDCLVIEVSLTAPSAGGKEASCHVGYRSCFYREIPLGETPETNRSLKFIESKKAFDPKLVYGDAPNPTQI